MEIFCCAIATPDSLTDRVGWKIASSMLARIRKAIQIGPDFSKEISCGSMRARRWGINWLRCSFRDLINWYPLHTRTSMHLNVWFSCYNFNYFQFRAFNDISYYYYYYYYFMAYTSLIPILVSQHKSRTPHGSMRLSTKLHREARNSDASTCGQVEFTMGVDRERRY